jgi:hypothetical protein
MAGDWIVPMYLTIFNLFKLISGVAPLDRLGDFVNGWHI